MGKEKKSDKEKSYTKKSDKKGANTLATATATSDVIKNTDMRDANTLATATAPSDVNDNANVQDSDHAEQGDNDPVEDDDAPTSDDGKDRSEVDHRQGDTDGSNTTVTRLHTGKRAADMETESYSTRSDTPEQQSHKKFRGTKLTTPRQPRFGTQRAESTTLWIYSTRSGISSTS